MPNAKGKSIDTTYLSIDNAERRGFLHRDYLAHCFRWSHVVKYLQKLNRYKTASIVDLGCGKETPLLKTLYSMRMLPAKYLGVDYGPIHLLPSLQTSANQERITVHEHTSILDINRLPSTNVTVVVMFEVLEHMEKEDGIKVLTHIRDNIIDKGTVFFMSTPCYDGFNKADNHVYEWTYKELFDQLIDLKFTIEDAWGTFASMKDYKDKLDVHQKAVYTKLSEYFDTNVLACIFAPIFPEYSRNCLWQLTK